MDLLELRNQIDVIDSQIVELFEKRMDICKGVAQYKIENGKKVFDRQLMYAAIIIMRNTVS